ncbi:filamin/ABP280 repeat domain-containing protein [Streptomyces sp. C10-9-1]|uniref:filamin/ABP280 repeat domain-containing protein n=1 Tax=Streptomyces sp. C10-9-1 TaxID=1859285 RepID=UPI003D71B6A7
MPFDLGATARLTAECRDPGGALVTAATAVATVTLPDGTTATPAVTEESTGRYQADYVTTVPGRHTVHWVWTGPAAAYTDVLDVLEAAPPAILSLADAKQHLNLRSSDDDAEVRYWSIVTTRAVEYYTGPIVPRPVTEEHTVRGASAVFLLQAPVQEVTAVDQLLTGAAAYTVGDLAVNGATGEVYRPDGGRLSGRLRFTYTAGRTVFRENIPAGARIILQHLWRTQRAGRRGAVAGGGDDYSVTEPIPGIGYAVPNRALELLAPDRLPPGVA